MDTEAARNALATILGESPPEGLNHLSVEALSQLTTLLTQSRDRQQKQMKQALEDALGYVPALARGAVRRVLFPPEDRT